MRNSRARSALRGERRELLAIVASDDINSAFQALRSDPLGKDAAVIGEVVDDHPGFVMMKTRVGGTRVVDVLFGEQLPRIC
jgi:hydrogenase expression/formation protein HypE